MSLGSMIKWMDSSTDSVLEAYTRFNGYGCYCGYKGFAGMPVDAVDWYVIHVHFNADFHVTVLLPFLGSATA